jgi:PTH1 family peptidyl-tRNA hydrolase
VRLVAGLGNPGREYEGTPHNIGFAVVDLLAGRLDCRMRRSLRVSARVARASWAGESIVLVEPLTYMNASGDAVGSLVRRHGVTADGLVVVLDDADLPLGRIRIRPQGGAGGHRGLASIIGAVGTEAFPRIRVGIGRRGEAQDALVEHVLTPFDADGRSVAGEAVARAAEAVLWLVEHGVASAMNRFNGTLTRDDDSAKEMKE